MSIGYFPMIYEDELIYIILVRFYAHNRYLFYVWCAEDIYMYKTKRPDTKFVNKIKLEIVEIIGRQMAWEDVIRKHTMYLYYSRFLEKEKKDKAKQALTDMGNPDNSSMFSAPIIKICSERGIQSVYTSRKNEKVQLKAKEQRLLIERKFWLEVKEKHPGMSLKQLCAIDGYEGYLIYLRKRDKEWTDKNYFYKESRDLKGWKKLDEETLPLLQNEIETMLWRYFGENNLQLDGKKTQSV